MSNRNGSSPVQLVSKQRPSPSGIAFRLNYRPPIWKYKSDRSYANLYIVELSRFFHCLVDTARQMLHALALVLW